MGNQKDIVISNKEPYCCGVVRKNDETCYSVSFLLESSVPLIKIANFQVNCGEDWLKYLPYFDRFRNPSDSWDKYGSSFAFRLEINDHVKDGAGVEISYVKSSCFGNTCEGMGKIKLLSLMQRVAIRKIDRQCIELYGKSCEELLMEARERMG